MSVMPDVAVCAQCGGELTRVGAGPVWCTACEWNLAAYEPPPGARPSRARQRSHRRGFQLNATLLGQLRDALPARPGWNATRVALLAVSASLLIVTVAIFGAGVYLIVSAAVGWKILGVLLALFGLELRPRWPRLPRQAEPARRADLPELYGLVDRLGAELGAPPVSGIVLDDSLNAWAGRYGLRRRCVLGIGVPLWLSLGPDARTALLGHELGHLVNGDPGQALLTQPALTTFGRLAAIFDPRGMAYSPRGRNSIDVILSRFATHLLFTPLRWLCIRAHRAMWRLAAHDHRRAELYADALAVRVAGTRGAAELMTANLLDDPIRTALRRSAAASRSPQDWHLAAQQALQQPAQALRRREQHSIRIEASSYGTHPPAGLRRRLVDSWPTTPAVSPANHAEFARIDAELDARYQRLRDTLLKW
jgi:Zn-dependent protease with chaperone function